MRAVIQLTILLPRSYTLHIHFIARLQQSAHKVKILTDFLNNSRSCFKNELTNTRSVSTHRMHFFMMNPNIAMKIWILKTFFKNWQFQPVVCCSCVGRVKHPSKHFLLTHTRCLTRPPVGLTDKYDISYLPILINNSCQYRNCLVFKKPGLW